MKPPAAYLISKDSSRAGGRNFIRSEPHRGKPGRDSESENLRSSHYRLTDKRDPEAIWNFICLEYFFFFNL